MDFIWGTSDATLVESSSLHFINDVGGGAASYGLFVARTGTTIAAAANGTVGKGYVLLNSAVNVDANVTAYFGRDAGVGAYYDQAALVNVTFSGAGMVGAGVGTSPHRRSRSAIRATSAGSRRAARASISRRTPPIR